MYRDRYVYIDCDKDELSELLYEKLRRRGIDAVWYKTFLEDYHHGRWYRNDLPKIMEECFCRIVYCRDADALVNVCMRYDIRRSDIILVFADGLGYGNLPEFCREQLYSKEGRDYARKAYYSEKEIDELVYRIGGCMIEMQINHIVEEHVHGIHKQISRIEERLGVRPGGYGCSFHSGPYGESAMQSLRSIQDDLEETKRQTSYMDSFNTDMSERRLNESFDIINRRLSRLNDEINNKVFKAPEKVIYQPVVNDMMAAARLRYSDLLGETAGEPAEQDPVPEASKVYASVFAPSEFKRRYPLLIKVYLHLEEEKELVQSLAVESSKDAIRRAHSSLMMKLNIGDKVDVELTVKAQERLMSERKSVEWQGSFTNCDFSYFVPKGLDEDALICEVSFYKNEALIGNMQFVSEIVEIPTGGNAKVTARQFNRVFISYSHKDQDKAEIIAKAYRAAGVDYFFDRHTLQVGDIWNKEILKYIDVADLFILCWSRNAAESEYIPKEIDRAMERALPEEAAELKIKPYLIRPVDVFPPQLAEVQFEDLF